MSFDGEPAHELPVLRRPYGVTDANRVELLNDSHDRTAFSCGKPRLDDWLQRIAPGAARAGTAATYVALAQNQRVIGYDALVMASVTREETVAATRGRRDVMRRRATRLPHVTQACDTWGRSYEAPRV